MTKPFEMTREEAISLSMSFRNQVNNFRLRFNDCGSKKLQYDAEEYFTELELLQNKLEKFISGFEK